MALNFEQSCEWESANILHLVKGDPVLITAHPMCMLMECEEGSSAGWMGNVFRQTSLSIILNKQWPEYKPGEVF